MEPQGARADRGLSQRALADRLGVKQPHVNRVESGDVNPSIDTLARIADRLGIEIAVAIRPSGQASKLIRRRAETTDHLATYATRDATFVVAAT
ncbi:MAG: helix-turn-helix transcriptional regulator [Solirubrobacterales bacterium]|nr:helix-turn-helix transcriptional regulator [Solirubrobacterales bacterium]